MRDRIKALLDEGYGIRKIGRTLGLPHSTVSREVARNSCGNDGRTRPMKRRSYDSTVAHHKAYVRRKYAKYQGKKIQEHRALRSFIIEKLTQHCNPDEIAGIMKASPSLGFYASKTSIYEWLYSARGQKYCQHLYSSRFKPKPHQKNKTTRVMIPDRIPLSSRPEAATFRFESGHWEYDSVVSSKRFGSTSALAVLVERSSRLISARVVSNLKPVHYAEAIFRQLEGKKVLSLTTDNGIENRQHQMVTSQTRAPVFFTDPYSSWQKGSVENANKMLRRYFPKGTNFATVSQIAVDQAISRINQKPRKILGYMSSLEVAKRKGVFVASGALRG